VGLIRFVLRLVLLLLVAAALAVGISFVSPWPGVLAIRAAFAVWTAGTVAGLEALAPHEVRARLHIAHTPQDPQGRVDLYLPPGDPPAGGWPVVVWVHGGAWVAGDKADVGNWLRILSARGYGVVAPAYTRAPAAVHPEPARQVNAALAWVVREGAAQGLDPARVVLAGDSAGAQIAAQAGIAQVDAGYAARLGISPALPAGALRGMVLFCGGYDPAPVKGEGVFGWFVDTVFWAYFGRKDWRDSPMLADFAIPANLSAGLPPLFVSAGNADPLLAQSRALAAAADTRGIRVDSLFFADDHQPPLGHEYQFDLGGEAGRQAFDRMVAFLRGVTGG
jgi:acetyl esterase/lipase